MKKLTDKINIYAASMGKLFKIVAIATNECDANAFCSSHADVGVMAVDNNGLIYLAEYYGKTIPSKDYAEFFSLGEP